MFSQIIFHSITKHFEFITESIITIKMFRNWGLSVNESFWVSWLISYWIAAFQIKVLFATASEAAVIKSSKTESRSGLFLLLKEFL